jgi:sigma54-dependent transcription regulator
VDSLDISLFQMEHGKGGLSCHAGHLRAVTLRKPVLRRELIIIIVSPKGAGRTNLWRRIYGTRKNRHYLKEKELRMR